MLRAKSLPNPSTGPLLLRSFADFPLAKDHGLALPFAIPTPQKSLKTLPHLEPGTPDCPFFCVKEVACVAALPNPSREESWLLIINSLFQDILPLWDWLISLGGRELLFIFSRSWDFSFLSESRTPVEDQVSQEPPPHDHAPPRRHDDFFPFHCSGWGFWVVFFSSF